MFYAAQVLLSCMRTLEPKERSSRKNAITMEKYMGGAKPYLKVKVHQVQVPWLTDFPRIVFVVVVVVS